jgi:hypothetical protein
MKVRALKEGFYDGSRRRVGDVFVIPATAKVGKWMEVFDVAAKAVKEPEKQNDDKAKGKDDKAKGKG